jgi:hypothetical protein
MRAWSRHNIVFGAQPGVLWVGTPAGTLVEVSLDNQHVAMHDVLAGFRVTGLGAMATGELIAASGERDLALLSVPTGSAKSRLRTAARCGPWLRPSWTPPPRFPATPTWRHIWSYPMGRRPGSQTTWRQ